MEKHMENRVKLLDEIKPPQKKDWRKRASDVGRVVMNPIEPGRLPSFSLVFETKDNLTPSQEVRDQVPHKAYTDAMSRKAHRHACLVVAQTVGEIDWGFTKNDWTVLKAGDTGETMLVSVRMAIPKTEYERVKRQYLRAQMMRAAKGKKK